MEINPNICDCRNSDNPLSYIAWLVCKTSSPKYYLRIQSFTFTFNSLGQSIITMTISFKVYFNFKSLEGINEENMESHSLKLFKVRARQQHPSWECRINSELSQNPSHPESLITTNQLNLMR